MTECVLLFFGLLFSQGGQSDFSQLQSIHATFKTKHKHQLILHLDWKFQILDGLVSKTAIRHN